MLNTVHTVTTGRYRRIAKVDYPAAYAPSSRTDAAAHNFNCVQRAHAHYTENLTSLLGALLIAGLKYPVAASIMGAGWSLSRYMYMLGYSKGGESGKSRYKRGGSFFWIFQFGLIGMAAWTGISMVLGD